MNGTIPAIILAGGRASRLGGGDKCLRVLGGRPLLAHVIDAIAPQASPLILNANGDALRFAAFNLPVVADDLPDQPGPLAGILAGLDWVAAQRPGTECALSVPADCPFLPPDLVVRLADVRARHDAEIALAESDGRLHPVIGLWSVALRSDLRRALTVDGLRKVERFCDRRRSIRVNFGTVGGDPFFNINTDADLVAAERRLASVGPAAAGVSS
ncbi:molybdenum cofactor guanylyltransferase [Dongia mobilis]|uniref:Molybdenum cofactor guanylyltransferase n=1 Tax=Dongia mobilis TaxID=578943 RepID=A0A4R6WV04_9PROT|nr:molybdenum cofactor guanylyltransferase MobA [Dongia mobilis]TDQ84259.1 molybdenum cofactor guanylyltransferase [Dongia mobilis]